MNRSLRAAIYSGALLVALIAVFMLLGTGAVIGAPLENVPVVVRQPDGEVLNLFASGDEFYNWVHDAADYTIVRDPKTGYAEYARLENGDLVPSGYRVGFVAPSAVGLQSGLNLSPERMSEIQQGFSIPDRSVRPAPSSGTINNLAVFIRFSDESEFADLVSAYDEQFNMPSSLSMDAYFQEVSYGALSVSTTFYPTPPRINRGLLPGFASACLLPTV